MRVPLIDLQAQYRSLKSEIMTAIEEVLEGMQLFLGPRQRAFEEQFAAFSQCEHGIGVSNGTDALALALRACDIGPGDEVITVSNTFIATVEAIAMVGATPVFVDIDPTTYLLDWRQLPQAHTSRTRAIIPVHIYGHPADMQPILDFAHLHHLYVIEDASQAHGATYHKQRVGSLGDIACFSLYFSKNLGAYGEAGICTTNNPELAEKMRMYRDHGSKVRYHHELMGTNTRMDEIQAAVLLTKMSHLERWNALRQEHAAYYTRELVDVVDAVPFVEEWAEHSYCYYVIRVPERDRVLKALQDAGIGAGIHYPIPIHLQPACGQYGYRDGMLPITESLSSQLLTLPMYPELTTEQRKYVIDNVKECVSPRGSRFS